MDYDLNSVITNAYNITRTFKPDIKIPSNQVNANNTNIVILRRENVNGDDEIVAEMNVQKLKNNDDEEDEDEEDEKR